MICVNEAGYTWETIYVDDGGHIVRRVHGTCDSRFAPDGKWDVVGVVEVRPFGRYSHIKPLASLVGLGENAYTFKNGKPRFHVVDRDHGTLRVHGQGIRKVWQA